MDFSFKEEEEEVSTTEREREKERNETTEKNDWLNDQSSLFSSLKMKRVGFFFVWSDYVNGWRIFFRHGLRIPTSTNAVSSPSPRKKLLFHRDIKERKERKQETKS